jgi:hypothetical protein
VRVRPHGVGREPANRQHTQERQDVIYDLPVTVDQLNRRLIDTRIRYTNDPHGRKVADLTPDFGEPVPVFTSKRLGIVQITPYCTFIALGIQRWLVGTVASISMPIAISAALHDAIACTVCRWL